VKQTPLGFIGPPGFGQNRGCMSQWGARCLEKSGEDHLDILRFYYYGEDIQVLQAPGSCVTPTDADADGVADADDNCPDVVNADQRDTDGDTEGDACDLDDDNDGLLDEKDNCPKDPNHGQPDADKDGKGDECDGTSSGADGDGDGFADTDDNCPDVANPAQADSDDDGTGDFCDTDVDGDGVSNIFDDGPLVYDPKQDLPNCQGGFEVTGGANVQSSASCAVVVPGEGRTRGGLVGLLVAVALGLSRRRARRVAR
jgi:MYXO-CTERM domain-containing protein